MSDAGGGGGDDLLARKKEFVEAFFRRGAEFTAELLRENEKLRYRVVQLEEQLASSARAVPTPATFKELVERIHALETEREQLVSRFAAATATSREFVARYEQIERENQNLASLYVAADQLHSTLDLRSVLQIIVEILLNFVGGKTFAVYLLDEEARRLRAVASEGVARGEVPDVVLGEGTIGRVAAGGEASYGQVTSGAQPGGSEPGICFPLRFEGRVVGAIAVWEFLQQKSELADVDFEIFNLLAGHAASALEAARLAVAAQGRGAALPLPFADFEHLLP